MKKIVSGILAHVDAGKTTLSEAMLFTSGMKQKLGRVDRRDASLDTHTIERERGITVFSKQAQIELPHTELTLIDTPGHIDFSCETERSLAVQDYCILVISAPEGPTPHTLTLWNLLAAKKIPTFIFVNKTDIADRRRIDLLGELKRAFGTAVTDFNLECSHADRFFEECAAADEKLMGEYFDSGEICPSNIGKSIRARRIFPCFFGSALKCEGIKPLLDAIDKYTVPTPYSDTILGAKVYKITTDPSGVRLTYLKVTGGKLMPKDLINYVGEKGLLYSEKIESIRLYSADKYKSLKSAEAGTVCAVVGLNHTRAGGGIGAEYDEDTTLEPVLDYKMTFEDKNTDPHLAFMKLSPLAEEDPALNLRYDAAAGEIRVKLMGDIQTEVLTRVIYDRFNLRVCFSEGSIQYKETLREKVYGAGHFEPLMHYAEVRLRLEPLPQGSGLVFATDCPTDRLRANWQRLILSHLEERAHRGVLTGSPITDVKITLIAGRAHPKHTEGGDFREATFRALRQALMKSEPVLLEPIFEFVIELPEDMLGRAMTDISNMHGECEAPEFDSGMARLSGICPVYTMRNYAKELRAYTRGMGKITMNLAGYAECHNAEKIISEIGYVAELDSQVTADSVFCKNGAGYAVPWYEADEKMHTENPEAEASAAEDGSKGASSARKSVSQSYRGTAEEDRELMRIFERTYGKVRRRTAPDKIENTAKAEKPRRAKPIERGEEYVIVDGYNLIFAWDKLKQLAAAELGHARDTLIHIMCNYRAFKKCNLILVFDAYKRHDNKGSEEQIGGITVIYTKERQTADAYIERSTYSLSEKHSVRVVTSDYEEQLIVLGHGAARVPTREFIDEVETTTDLERLGIIQS